MSATEAMNDASQAPELPSETFCVLPWVQLYVHTDGTLRPCCNANESPDMINRTSDGQPHVAYGPEGIDGAWNSQFMRGMRRKMLAGERPPGCDFCFHQEDRGGRSARQNFNHQFRDQIAGAPSVTASDGAVAPNHFRSIELRLGNLCNLRCRMCSPTSSVLLIPEWSGLGERPAAHADLDRLKHLDWLDRPDFWRTVEEHAVHVDRMHFSGGEPFLVPEMFDALERIIAMKRAAEIKLSYNTNLTVLPQRLLDLWSHFKGVDIIVSLDGVREVNSFIRHPSHWPTLERHINVLSDGYARFKLDRVVFNTTVQVYNVSRLDEIISYAATVSHFKLYLMLLQVPSHFNIRILPAEMKTRAAERLRAAIERVSAHPPAHWQGGVARALAAFGNNIIAHMMSADRSDLIPQFRRWCAHQDRFRGQKTVEVLPELRPLLEDTSAEVAR